MLHLYHYFNTVSVSVSLPSVLVLHVVCGFLFLGKPVAGHQAWRQPAEGGRGRCPGSHHLLLLLHLHLGKGLHTSLVHSIKQHDITPAIRCWWIVDRLTVPPLLASELLEMCMSSFWLVFGCVWTCSFAYVCMWTHKCVDVVPTGRSDSLLYGEVKECVVWRGIHQAVPPSAKSTFCLTLLCRLPLLP